MQATQDYLCLTFSYVAPRRWSLHTSRSSEVFSFFTCSYACTRLVPIQSLDAPNSTKRHGIAPRRPSARRPPLSLNRSVPTCSHSRSI